MAALTGFVAASTLAFTPIQVDGLFIDGFAGGGGASTGIEQAIGRSVDIAINHSPTAIAIHKANHPDTTHYCQDIKALWPQAATKMQPVAGAWFSPDCKEFSKAKGAPVKDRSIRALCWEVVHWLKETRPTCGYLENVEEFEYAAPLDAEGRPIAGQEGREFKRFVRSIRALGYRVKWKILKACDYGTPTSRKRLYMVMRNDGKPIVWPKATHGAPGSPGVRSGRLLPYRTAAECIDWSIHCPSIFDRARELAEATKRRIAYGVMRYVVNALRPFIVPLTHQGSVRVHSADEPFRTITGAHRGELAAADVTVSPFVTYGQHGGANRSATDPLHTVAASKKDTNGVVGATLIGVGGRRGQSPPMSVDGSYPTTTAKADAAIATAHMEPLPDHSVQAGAFLSGFYGSDKTGSGGEPEKPLRTARASGQHHAVVAAHMAQFNTNPNGTVNEGHDVRGLVSTIATKGPHQGIVETTLIEEGTLPPDMMERAVMTAAFLVKYYGEGGQSQAVDRPIDVITGKARYAVVTVTIDAKTYVIVDIGLRMLKPRELANAQGFPPDYILDPIVRKFLRGKWVERRLTIAEQISAIGNSVCPPVARALILANQPNANDNARAAPPLRRAA